MLRRKLLYQALFVATLLAAFHLTATALYLYWSYLWLDLVAHFLGGFFLTLVGAALLMRFVSTTIPRIRFFITLILFVSTASVLWEVFEHLAGVPVEANFLLDTALDLLLDFLGAMSAYAYAVVSLKLYRHEERA